jgi:UDP-galactopyranose mutase
MPDKGYTAMFQNMLDHPLIDVSLSYDFAVQRPNLSWKTLIYTGPIDQFYNYQFGKLPYRSIQFEHRHQDIDQLQSVGTVNYPNDHAYTRITEFKHLTGSQAKGTSYVYEFPSSEGDPYYPIPRQENEVLFKQYSALAEQETSVHFVGRLAQYRYYNMDQVVAAALSLSKKIS